MDSGLWLDGHVRCLISTSAWRHATAFAHAETVPAWATASAPDWVLADLKSTLVEHSGEARAGCSALFLYGTLQWPATSGQRVSRLHRYRNKTA